MWSSGAASVSSPTTNGAQFAVLEKSPAQLLETLLLRCEAEYTAAKLWHKTAYDFTTVK